jgi:hypothetical protein
MKISIPTSLKEIPLSKFVEYQKSTKTDNEAVSILCDIENITLLKLKDIQDISAILNDVLNSDCEFVRRFTYKGVDYGFIPNLENLSAAEHIILEQTMASPDTWHLAMSVLYRPITKIKRNWFNKSEPFYDIQKFKEPNNAFIDAPSVYYLGACVFFFNLMKELESYMITYSMNILKSSKIMKADLIKSGDGMLA